MRPRDKAVGKAAKPQRPKTLKGHKTARVRSSRIARKETAARGFSCAALDLHHSDRIIRQAAEETGESPGCEMAAALALAVKLRFPASLDVDHGERVVQ